MVERILGAVLHTRARTPNLIFLFSMVFYILVDLTRVVFDLERMATGPEVIDEAVPEVLSEHIET